MTPGHLDRQPIYQQIIAHYEQRIRDGDLKPGDKIPSVAQLCEIWHVASATAARVPAALREAGLVQTSRKGTIVIRAK